MTSIRKLREQQFLTGAPFLSGFSVDLLESAFTLLHASLRDRRKLMSIATDNHFSSHAPGVVTMTVNGLDAWMNEVLVHLVLLREDQRALGQKPLYDKYQLLLGHFGAKPAGHEELVLLCRTRDEIAHHLPRNLGAHDAIPDWLEPLEDKALLLKTPHGNALPDKLCSYRLAHWAWSTCSAVAKDIVSKSGPSRESTVGMLAGNFDWHEGICHPDKLPEYDAAHGIKMPPPFDFKAFVRRDGEK